MAYRQETYRFLRGTVPPDAATDADRYGLQEDGASAVLKLENQLPHKTVVVRGTFTATTVQLQGSLDGTNWISAGSAVSVPANFDIEGVWLFLRVNIAGYVSGEVFVDVGTTTAN